jgi:large subunit ribosomal protein L9
MEVILLERVGRLGQMGDTVRVKDGFARNFLLPQGKALRATKENKARYEGMRKDLEARNLEHRSEAEKVSSKLDGKSFTVLRQASEAGHLYGSVSARDIAAMITESGVTVERSQIVLHAPIKTIGLHKIAVTLHPEVEIAVSLAVARNDDEAQRLLRGEDITVRREEAEEEAEAAKQAAEAFFEPEAIKAQDESASEEPAEKA